MYQELRARREHSAVLAACCLASMACGGTLRAEPERLAGSAFVVPHAFDRRDGAWEAKDENGLPVTLVALSVNDRVEVGGAVAAHARRTVEAELLRRGFDRVEVLESRTVEVDRVPALRLHASMCRGGSRLEVLLGLVSARDTLVLALTCEPESLPFARATLEEIFASVRVEDRPGMLEELPASHCGALLGVLAGAACAAWRRRAGSRARVR